MVTLPVDRRKATWGRSRDPFCRWRTRLSVVVGAAGPALRGREARGKDGLAVAAGDFELLLLQAGGTGEVRAFEAGPVEIGARQVDSVEGEAAELRPGQVRLAEVDAGKLGAG